MKREAALYEPLAAFLRQQAEEDEVEAVVCNTETSRLAANGRTRTSRRWPSNTTLSSGKCGWWSRLLKREQFPHWSVDAVYEAASHHRFSHEAWVVLEWPKGLVSSLTDPTYKLDQIARECQRFGIGLASLQPHYNSSDFLPGLSPEPQTPEDEDVESWLTYVFSRMPTLSTEFDERIKKVASAVVAWDGPIEKNHGTAGGSGAGLLPAGMEGRCPSPHSVRGRMEKSGRADLQAGSL